MYFGYRNQMLIKIRRFSMSVLTVPGHLAVYTFCRVSFLQLEQSDIAFSGASNTSSDHGLLVSLVVCTAVVQCMSDHFLSLFLSFCPMVYLINDSMSLW